MLIRYIIQPFSTCATCLEASGCRPPHASILLPLSRALYMKHSLHNGNGPTQDEPSLSNGLSPSPVSASSGHDPTEQRPMPSLSEEETEQRSDSEWQESSPSDTTKQQPIETVSSPTAPLGGSLRETAGSPGTVVNGTAPANVRDSSWLELEVCREYSRGACSRADCRFIHPDGNVLVKDGKVTCCFDYLKVGRVGFRGGGTLDKSDWFYQCITLYLSFLLFVF